jgi:hypothetical protein
MKMQEIVKAAKQLAEPPEELWSKIKARLEVWKTVEGFEAYQVSNMGRVRRVLPDKIGRTTHLGKVLKPNLHNCGYLAVCLYNAGKQTTVLIHWLVAKAFVTNPNNLPEINHKGTKTDNRAIKLEWRSTRGHGIDTVKRGQKGEGVSFHKINKRWGASYYPEPGRRKHIGSYRTKREALAARKTAVASLPNIA